MGDKRDSLRCKCSSPTKRCGNRVAHFPGPILQIYGPDFDEKSDWKYPPVVGQKSYVGSAATWNAQSGISFNPAKHDQEDTTAFPLTEQARNAVVKGGYTSDWWWFGKLANGSYVVPGNYTCVFSSFSSFFYLSSFLLLLSTSCADS